MFAVTPFRKPFLNVPAVVGTFSLLFKLLLCVGRRDDSDGWVIGVWFNSVDKSVDACLMCVFVVT